MATDEPIEASLGHVLLQIFSAYKFLSDIADLAADNLDLTPPLYVRNRPSDAQIQSFVRQVFHDERLLREGVLIAPMVFARKDSVGNIVGDTVLLRVEGIGSTPRKAVLSSRFLTPDDKVKALDDVFRDHFASELEMLADERYERVPDRERGIFLKLLPNGEFSRRKDYRDLPVEQYRRSADRKAAFLNGLASAEEKSLSAELARRVVYYDKLITTISDGLTAKGVLDKIAEAQRLHNQSRQLLVEARKSFDRAERWGRAVAITQWVGLGLQAASILNAQYVQEKANQEMASAFAQMEAGQIEFRKRLDTYNKSLQDLNDMMKVHASQAPSLDNIMNSLQGLDVMGIFGAMGIVGRRTDTGKVEAHYGEIFIRP